MIKINPRNDPPMELNPRPRESKWQILCHEFKFLVFYPVPVKFSPSFCCPACWCWLWTPWWRCGWFQGNRRSCSTSPGVCVFPPPPFCFCRRIFSSSLSLSVQAANGRKGLVRTCLAKWFYSKAKIYSRIII